MCIVIDAGIWFDLDSCGLAHRGAALSPRIVSVDLLVDKELLIPDGQALKHSGLVAMSISGVSIIKAADWQVQHPELSTPDVWSLALALERGWRLATRDRLLKQCAQENGVSLCSVVAVLAMMAGEGLLTMPDIARFKKAMHDSNRPYDKAELGQIEKTLRAAT